MNTRIIYFPNGATVNGTAEAVMQVYLLTYAGIACICYGLNWLVNYFAPQWVHIGMLAWVVVPAAILLSAALLFVSAVGFTSIEATSVKLLYSFGLPLATVYLQLDYLHLPWLSQLLFFLPESVLKHNPALIDLAMNGFPIPLFRLNELAEIISGRSSVGVVIYVLVVAAVLFGLLKLLCINAKVFNTVKVLMIIGFAYSFGGQLLGFAQQLLLQAGWMSPL